MTADLRATIVAKFAKEFAAYERLAALTQELLDANADKVMSVPGRRFSIRRLPPLDR